MAGAALGLAWTAGFVDAVGYMVILGVYSSHMTGNTAALGRHLRIADWRFAWKHGWPILTFVLGLIVSASITEWGRRHRLHSRMSVVFGIEIVLLLTLVFTLPAVPVSIAWLGLPAFAMGMQTVTITKVGTQRVYSTYMTGNLAKFAEALTGYFFWLADAARPAEAPGGRRRRWLGAAVRHRLLGHALLNVGLWALFLAGAFSGAAAVLVWQIHALWGPVVALAGLTFVDLLRPIAAVGNSEPPGFES